MREARPWRLYPSLSVRRQLFDLSCGRLLLFTIRRKVEWGEAWAPKLMDN